MDNDEFARRCQALHDAMGKLWEKEQDGDIIMAVLCRAVVLMALTYDDPKEALRSLVTVMVGDLNQLNK